MIKLFKFNCISHQVQWRIDEISNDDLSMIGYHTTSRRWYIWQYIYVILIIIWLYNITTSGNSYYHYIRSWSLFTIRLKQKFTLFDVHNCLLSSSTHIVFIIYTESSSYTHSIHHRVFITESSSQSLHHRVFIIYT